MNALISKKIALCALGLMTSLGASSVHALDSNVHFSGTLVSEPCNLDPQTSDITVDFQSVVAKYLYLNTRTKSIPFVINLTDCDISVGNKATVIFKGTESAALPGELAVTGAATGIAIGMETPDGDALPFNQSTPASLLTAGTTQLTFMAFVIGEPIAISNQKITPGDFSATATFELTYP